MLTDDFSGLHYLSDEALSAIVRGVRSNPPKGWDECRIYDTRLSYEASLLIGRRRTWKFGPRAA
jgi:hypothetical protein